MGFWWSPGTRIFGSLTLTVRRSVRRPESLLRDAVRLADESLRSMTPDSDSVVFWRVRVMTLEKLESQSHDSERVGDSAVFMGVVTLGKPDFRPFSARNG